MNFLRLGVFDGCSGRCSTQLGVLVSCSALCSPGGRGRSQAAPSLAASLLPMGGR